MDNSLLLDTCALLWLGGAPERFSRATRKAIETAQLLYVSPVSLWEVAFKCQIGKLRLSLTPEDWFETLKGDYGLTVVPLGESVMLRAAQLPLIHRDPADRFIISLALLRGLTVVTGDERFAKYGVRTIV